MKYKYKFSVIIPIYNIENYLEKAIKSIINQSIGFDNIQLILVNDGSTDKSPNICEKYNKKYSNVVYINKPNGGVSSARNAGISKIEGKYVNFLDGDDLWNKNSFSKVWNFFETNYETIDVVACRQKCFEAQNNYVALDYKFKDGNMIADIHKNPDYIHCSVTCSFFKTSAIKDNIFDEKLCYAEDAKFLNQILLKKEKYGLLHDVTHSYRKRKNASSATQTLNKDTTRYKETPKYYYEYFYDFSIEKYGKIIPYIQYLIMNAVKHRVNNQVLDNIPKKIKKDYIKSLIDLIKKTDTDILFNLKNVKLTLKLYMLKIKYNNYSNDKIINNYITTDLNKKRLNKTIKLSINNLNIKDNNLLIEGTLTTSILHDDKDFTINNKKVKLTKIPSNSKLSVLDEEMINTYTYTESIPLNDKKIIFIYKNNKLTPVSKKLKYNYYHIDNYLIIKREKSIIIKKYRFKTLLKLRIKYILKK